MAKDEPLPPPPPRRGPAAVEDVEYEELPPQQHGGAHPHGAAYAPHAHAPEPEPRTQRFDARQERPYAEPPPRPQSATDPGWSAYSAADAWGAQGVAQHAGAGPIDRVGVVLPAGVRPGDLRPIAPQVRRGKLKKRLRLVRRQREVLLRDLGGLVFDVYRFGQDPALHAEQSRLVASRLARLAGLDAELRQLEDRLDVPRGRTVLREPGIGGACPDCSELYGSDARFCSNCGRAVPQAGAAPLAEGGVALVPAGPPVAPEAEEPVDAQVVERPR